MSSNTVTLSWFIRHLKKPVVSSILEFFFYQGLGFLEIPRFFHSNLEKFLYFESAVYLQYLLWFLRIGCLLDIIFAISIYNTKTIYKVCSVIFVQRWNFFGWVIIRKYCRVSHFLQFSCCWRISRGVTNEEIAGGKFLFVFLYAKTLKMPRSPEKYMDESGNFALTTEEEPCSLRTFERVKT